MGCFVTVKTTTRFLKHHEIRQKAELSHSCGSTSGSSLVKILFALTMKSNLAERKLLESDETGVFPVTKKKEINYLSSYKLITIVNYAFEFLSIFTLSDKVLKNSLTRLANPVLSCILYVNLCNFDCLKASQF